MGSFSLTKGSVLSNLYAGLLLLLSKPQQDFFVDVDKIILKLIWKCKGIRIARIILKEKNIIGGISLPDFKIT